MPCVKVKTQMGESFRIRSVMTRVLKHREIYLEPAMRGSTRELKLWWDTQGT